MAEDTIAPAGDRKLLKTLGSFTRDEIKRFREYILLSYLSNKGPLLEFLDVLLPMISKGETPNAAQIIKLLLKTAKLSRATYRSLFMDLTRMVQSFLQNERYKGKPEQAVSDMLSAVNARRLGKLFDINMSLARKLQSNVSSHSAEFYLREFMLASEKDLHAELAKASHSKDSSFATMALLDAFYITNKLRYACAVRHFDHRHQEEDGLLTEVLDQAGSGKYTDFPSVQVYSAIYRMLYDGENEAHFVDLKATLKSKQKQLSDLILRDAYVFAINYCVAQVNKGKFNYLRDVYDLYKIALDKNFLYEEGELSPWDYSNIMALGVQLRDYKWSEKLIEVYKERVPTASKKMNVITFNMAKMYFFSGRYKDVLQLLEGVKSDELMYVLGSNALLIRTYYELGEKDELFKLLTEFRTNLKRRKKIDANERKHYLQFIEFTMQLSTIARRDKKSLRALKLAIKDKPDTAESEWLLEKTS